jgi:hypothetical protein
LYLELSQISTTISPYQGKLATPTNAPHRTDLQLSKASYIIRLWLFL